MTIIYDSRTTHRAGRIEALEQAFAVAKHEVENGGTAWTVVSALWLLLDDAKRES